MNGFMNEYMRDFNENLNNQFFFASQSSSQVLDKGRWEFSIIGGSAYLSESELSEPSITDLPNGGRIGFNGPVPSIFGSSETVPLIFTFSDPETGLPIINPFSGEQLSLSFDAPGGLGLGFGVTPSAALALAYGTGYGTEVKVYITPMMLSALGATEEGIGFQRDFAWGLQLKHDFATWIPGMKEKGYHLALAGGFSSYRLNLSTNLLDAPLSTSITDSVSIKAIDNLSGANYELHTYGGRLLVGKTWGFIEIALSADYTANAYSMSSTGSLDIELVDPTNPSNDQYTELTGLLDFSGSNGSWGYGASLTLGQGWFRTALSYRRANTNFAALSLQFHFGKKAVTNANPPSYENSYSNH